MESEILYLDSRRWCPRSSTVVSFASTNYNKSTYHDNIRLVAVRVACCISGLVDCETTGSFMVLYNYYSLDTSPRRWEQNLLCPSCLHSAYCQPCWHPTKTRYEYMMWLEFEAIHTPLNLSWSLRGFRNLDTIRLVLRLIYLALWLTHCRCSIQHHWQ
jgi:hypothetical protein